MASLLIEQKGRLGYNHIDKLGFVEAYPASHQEVFTMQNIKSGFKATGIVPFSPNAVLDKLNKCGDCYPHSEPWG
jgi:hypothetical protein